VEPGALLRPVCIGRTAAATSTAMLAHARRIVSGCGTASGVIVQGKVPLNQLRPASGVSLMHAADSPRPVRPLEFVRRATR